MRDLHEVKMFGRYRNKKMKNIDGFFVVCAKSRETGLPYDVLLDSLGMRKRFPGRPRIYVIIGGIAVPVSVSDNPVVLSGFDFDGADEVREWVMRHRTELLMHWNNEMDDLGVLNRITGG